MKGTNRNNNLSTTSQVIAIVDDEPSVLRGLSRLLHSHHFKTETFSSAESFLERDGINDISCIILDINLTCMSGIELRHCLAARGSAIPVIFITALDSAAARKEAMEAGCAAFLPKPFTGQELIGAIEKAIPVVSENHIRTY